MKKSENKVIKIYKQLYSQYGPQGWWPILAYEGKNTQKQGNKDGYHILDYGFPRNQNEKFEICLGAILTQNTSFKQVVVSLNNLKNNNCLNYKAIEKLDSQEFKNMIKPSGFLNQKSSYILNFINFFKELDGKIPSRQDLLSIKGIGQETADSILLYAYNQPEFVVDAYTKRFLLHLGLIDETFKYIDIKNFIEQELKKTEKDPQKLVIIYQEFHALIVNHAKLHYSKKPYGINCFVKERI